MSTFARGGRFIRGGFYNFRCRPTHAYLSTVTLFRFTVAFMVYRRHRIQLPIGLPEWAYPIGCPPKGGRVIIELCCYAKHTVQYDSCQEGKIES